jgi:hypothetical protein
MPLAVLKQMAAKLFNQNGGARAAAKHGSKHTAVHTGSSWGMMVGLFVGALVVLLLKAWLVQWTYNYIAPKLIMSHNSQTMDAVMQNFQPLTYTNSLAFVILVNSLVN